ncbi:hypothetical protein DV737_g3043, partial [Chaetothyriales sp. CBS 132003]
MAPLHSSYPWLEPSKPPIVSAPMMKIAMAELALAVSRARGLGFLAAGFDLSPLAKHLAEVARLHASKPISQAPEDVLPIGVGFLNWGADIDLAVEALTKFPVAAVWFFAPAQLPDLLPWAAAIREINRGRTQIWVQVGTVAEALEVANTVKPDVLVVQGADSGGHGLVQRAGITTLLPEVSDALAEQGINMPLVAAGGIIDGRGAAAALALGADGLCLGTRFLASHEAAIAKGYKDQILRVADGGVTTVVSTVYDVVRGITGWPTSYNGRGVANRSYLDAMEGMSNEENEALYKEAIKVGDAGWGPEGRMTTYAGTGLGLVREDKAAADIVAEVRDDAVAILRRRAGVYEAKVSSRATE